MEYAAQEETHRANKRSRPSWSHRIRNWKWKWIPTSAQKLEKAEQHLFRYVKSAKHWDFVPVCDGRYQLRYAFFEDFESKLGIKEVKCPLVMMHGFGAGMGVFIYNFDGLSQDRKVYSFDSLGFGRSTHHTFSKNHNIVEAEWIQSIEDFRTAMQLDKMILLGHSFGGYLAGCYALKYPNRVRHLILVDPWGLTKHPLPPNRLSQYPPWARQVNLFAAHFNPFAGLRVSGRLGPIIVRLLRPQLGRRFVETNEERSIFDYAYHMNVQHPSGESGFVTLSCPVRGIERARNPLITRLPNLPQNIPISFIYGSNDWFNDGSAAELMQIRKKSKSYVRIEIINGGSHPVYADEPECFNETVNEICRLVDCNKDLL